MKKMDNKTIGMVILVIIGLIILITAFTQYMFMNKWVQVIIGIILIIIGGALKYWKKK